MFEPIIIIPIIYNNSLNVVEFGIGELNILENITKDLFILIPEPDFEDLSLIMRILAGLSPATGKRLTS